MELLIPLTTMVMVNAYIGLLKQTSLDQDQILLLLVSPMEIIMGV